MLLTRSARADGAATGSTPREFVKAENSTAEESAQRRGGDATDGKLQANRLLCSPQPGFS